MPLNSPNRLPFGVAPGSGESSGYLAKPREVELPPGESKTSAQAPGRLIVRQVPRHQTVHLRRPLVFNDNDQAAQGVAAVRSTEQPKGSLRQQEKGCTVTSVKKGTFLQAMQAVESKFKSKAPPNISKRNATPNSGRQAGSKRVGAICISAFTILGHSELSSVELHLAVAANPPNESSMRGWLL